MTAFISGAWWAAVYGVAQSRTRLKWLSSSSSFHPKEISTFWKAYWNNLFIFPYLFSFLFYVFCKLKMWCTFFTLITTIQIYFWYICHIKDCIYFAMKHYILKQHKEMIEFKNYHFASIIEIIDSVQNHQWVLKPLSSTWTGYLLNLKVLPYKLQ